MKNSFDEKILEEAKDWLAAKQNVVLATVIQTWGSSPRPVGSRMIVNDKGDFSGSVSGGCVESAVVRECVGIIKDKKPFKKIEDVLSSNFSQSSIDSINISSKGFNEDIHASAEYRAHIIKIMAKKAVSSC